MRKYLALFLVLLLAGTGITVYANKALDAPMDDVSFTEEVLYGEHAALDGLHIVKNTEYANHLLWVSDLNFDKDGIDSKTDFSCSGKSLYEVFPYDFESYYGIDMWTNLDYTYLFDGNFSENYPLGQVYQQLWDQTNEGESAHTTVRLKDYMDYYPIEINIDLENINYYYYPEIDSDGDYSNPETYAIRKLKEYFRIPVIEDQYYEFGFDKDYGGGISGEYSGDVEEGDLYSFTASSATTKDACFIWFDNKTRDGKKVDTSFIPDGYGIYKLPYGPNKDEHREEGFPAEMNDVYVDEISNFYPVDPDNTIIDVQISKGETTLFMNTLENGIYYTSIIDLSSGQMLDHIELHEKSQDPDVWDVPETYIKGDLVLMTSCGYLYLYKENDHGKWELVIDSQPMDIEKESDFALNDIFNNYNMAYDNERLVVIVDADMTGDPYYADDELIRYYYHNSSFYLAVYTKDGLQYYGCFKNSLDNLNILSEEERSYGFRDSLVRAVDQKSSDIWWK